LFHRALPLRLPLPHRPQAPERPRRFRRDQATKGQRRRNDDRSQSTHVVVSLTDSFPPPM
jgi:hypothetical protein